MKNWKTSLVVIALLGACIVAGANLFEDVTASTQGLPPKERNPNLATAPPPDSGRLAGNPPGGRMFSEAERVKMATEIGLSQEQQDKIDKIMKEAQDAPPEKRMESFAKMQEVMTPEQQQKAMETMRARGEARMAQRLEEARKIMNDKDYNDYKKKMEGMRDRMRAGGFGGRGGPGGPGGGPPGPPPGT